MEQYIRGFAEKAVALLRSLPAVEIAKAMNILQAAFERATAGKAAPSGDADTKGHSPDPEKLEQARSLRDELNRRQPRPERDRER